MKKITYLQSDPNLEIKVRNLLGKEVKGDFSLYLKTILLLAGFCFVYSLPFLFSPPFWLLFLLAMVEGFFMAAIGMGIMHDANHGSFSKKKWLNFLFGASLYLLGGYVLNWKTQHNVCHHSFTNSIDLDKDLSGVGVFRFCFRQPLKKIHRYQAWYAPLLYSFMTLYWCTLKDFINAYQFYKEKTKGFKNIGFHFCMIFLLKIVYFLFWIGLPLIFWKVSFISTLLFFIIMHFVAGLFLSLVFQLAHVTSFTEFPKPIVFDTREEHQIRTTCNFAEDNKFITWITGGLNHQIEHHLFPHISHVHYPKIAPIVKEYCKEKKHPYNSAGNFIRAVISHFEYLSKLGRINDPS